MPMDPQWDYRFPLRKTYPEDNYAHTCLMMKSILEEEGIFTQVVTIPTPGLREEDEIPAAVAVWEMTPCPEKGYSIPSSEFYPTPPWRRGELEERFAYFSWLVTGGRRWMPTRCQLRAHEGF